MNVERRIVWIYLRAFAIPRVQARMALPMLLRQAVIPAKIANVQSRKPRPTAVAQAAIARPIGARTCECIARPAAAIPWPMPLMHDVRPRQTALAQAAMQRPVGARQFL